MSDKQKLIMEEALTRFIDESLQGRQPDINEFARRYPQCEAQLKVRIRDLREIDSLFDSIVQTDESDFENISAEENLVGRKVTSFEIVKIIGSGGMGVVYLAHDTKLKRSVAIKSMPAQLAENSTARVRFRREAELLASLNHPNIAVIHDIIEQNDGAGYLVLEFVPGETLAERISRKPLELKDILSIGQQIAEAVSSAHKKGIVHRDLKPGNIKITPEGRIKVLDFGLAKPSASEDKKSDVTATQPGRIIGTPAYMSPEQARGKPADHRTDIWSFGCIMYEMLTGKFPFEGETAADTLARIIERQPNWELLPNEIPENIRLLLSRCLEKDPARRLGDIADTAIEIRDTLSRPATRPAAPVRTLWRWAMTTGLVIAAIVVALNIGRCREQLIVSPGRIKSLAVLPLENLSGDPNQEYFSDGMTDALVANLGKIGALRVISRQSVMRYKGSYKPLPEIARELNVDAVVEGSVLRVAERVRITAQLIEGATDRHLWVESYERDLHDILDLQSEVAQAIAREIKVAVTPTEETRLTSNRLVNPEAHDLYLRGKYHYFKGINLKDTKKELEKANEYLQQAIGVDPNYAQAYAGLAASYEYLSWAGHLPLDEAKSKTIPILNKALEIDNTLAEAHLALSGVRFYLYWDWAEGEREIKLTIALNPNLAEAHYEYAYYLMATGRFDESIAEARLALQLDPLSYPYEFALAVMYSYARQYDEAIEQYQHVAELEPKKSEAYFGLAEIYEQMRRYENAVKARQKGLILSGIPLEEVEVLDRAYSESGPKGYWMWRLEKLKGQFEHNPYLAAKIYTQLGDKDQAFAWLEKAYEEHNGKMFTLKVHPLLDPLRSDPRFKDLLHRMNFPQ
jgi:serine/threonine-protein kinase